MSEKYFKTKGGYTIIETMISIAVFLVVVMVGMDTLLNANLVHQKSQDMRSILDSVSFAMEDMSRNIRTGYNYHCVTSSIPTGDASPLSDPKSCITGWGLAFEYATGDSTDQDGDAVDYNDQWVYYIDQGALYKSTQGPYTPESFVRLTPTEVVLHPGSSFSVLGAEPPNDGNTQQPLVTIRLSGDITARNGSTSSFSLQTSVSQRVIDILQ